MGQAKKLQSWLPLWGRHCSQYECSGTMFSEAQENLLITKNTIIKLISDQCGLTIALQEDQPQHHAQRVQVEFLCGAIPGESPVVVAHPNTGQHHRCQTQHLWSSHQPGKHGATSAWSWFIHFLRRMKQKDDAYEKKDWTCLTMKGPICYFLGSFTSSNTPRLQKRIYLNSAPMHFWMLMTNLVLVTTAVKLAFCLESQRRPFSSLCTSRFCASSQPIWIWGSQTLKILTMLISKDKWSLMFATVIWMCLYVTQVAKLGCKTRKTVRSAVSNVNNICPCHDSFHLVSLKAVTLGGLILFFFSNE